MLVIITQIIPWTFWREYLLVLCVLHVLLAWLLMYQVQIFKHTILEICLLYRGNILSKKYEANAPEFFKNICTGVIIYTDVIICTGVITCTCVIICTVVIMISVGGIRGKLKGATTWSDLLGIMDWGRSQDLASVGQNDLRIKALNKDPPVI